MANKTISKAFQFPVGLPVHSDSRKHDLTTGEPISLDALPLVAGFVVLSLSAAVIIGWLMRINTLQTFGISSVTVKPNTAIGLMLCSLALILAPTRSRQSRWQKVSATTLAVMAALLGALTVLEYVTALDFSIDELFISVPDDPSHSGSPGRMALVTASAITLLGVGVFLNVNRVSRTAGVCQFFMLAAGTTALTSLLGYAYGAIPTVGAGQGIQIAIPTAVSVLVLSLGALALRPEIGFVATLLSRSAGGTLARRLLPFAFVVPLSLGAFRIVGHWIAPFSIATQTAVVAILTMLSFGTIIWRTAVSLDVADRKRRIAEEERVTLVSQEEAARVRADAEHTARGVAESALEEAEFASRERTEALTLLEVVLSSAPIGFAVLDRECRFVRVNRMLAELHGVPEEEHIGRKISDLSPDVGPRIGALASEVFRSRTPVLNAQFVVRTPGDGVSGPEDRHLLVSFYPIAGADGDPIAVGAFFVDTSDVRFLEEQLAQSQKMEAVGQLAGGIAHDFNNLLTVITVYSALLLEEIGSDDPKRVDIQEIRQAAERASALTRQLLAFSRKQLVQPRHVSINDVVRGVGRMLPRLIGEDITIETSLDDDISLVHADPGQLEQVIINLAVNARDAMPDGGRLRILTRNTVLDNGTLGSRVGAAPGDYVMLSVSDTGTGMPPEVKRRIFEPFYTTKESGRGTGLGLSTVFGIVKQAAGDITVYSEMGEGTTFNLYFPALAPHSAGHAHGERTEIVRGGSETVLLVEDDPHLLLLSERILDRLGYAVILSRNGDEAIEVVERHGYDIAIVVTDVVMPVRGGRLLAERVNELRPDLPVLFMSGYTSDEITRRGIFEGEVPFIQKPFSPDDLGRKVREVLDSVKAAR